MRTVKDFTERMCGSELPLDSAVVKSLVRHAGWAFSCYQRGPGGGTAYKRWNKKTFRSEIACFGDYILYVQASQDCWPRAEVPRQVAGGWV